MSVSPLNCAREAWSPLSPSATSLLRSSRLSYLNAIRCQTYGSAAATDRTSRTVDACHFPKGSRGRR